MYKRLLVAALLFTLTSTASVSTPVVIKDDYGGKVSDYISRWSQYETSGRNVVIDGACTSACARFMTLSKACATPQAYFYLHGITYADDGIVDREAGMRDSRRWETAAAFALQERHDAFSFGYEKNPKKLIEYKEPGVWVVYFRLQKGTYQKFLKVRASLLVPRCPSTTAPSTRPPR